MVIGIARMMKFFGHDDYQIAYFFLVAVPQGIYHNHKKSSREEWRRSTEYGGRVDMEEWKKEKLEFRIASGQICSARGDRAKKRGFSIRSDERWRNLGTASFTVDIFGHQERVKAFSPQIHGNIIHLWMNRIDGICIDHEQMNKSAIEPLAQTHMSVIWILKTKFDLEML